MNNIYYWMFGPMGCQLSSLAYAIKCKEYFNLDKINYIKNINFWNYNSKQNHFSYHSILEDHLEIKNVVEVDNNTDYIAQFLLKTNEKKEQDIVNFEIKDKDLFIYDLARFPLNTKFKPLDFRLSNLDIITTIHKNCNFINMEEFEENFQKLDKEIDLSNRYGIHIDLQDLIELQYYYKADDEMSIFLDNISKICNSKLYIYCPSLDLLDKLHIEDYIDKSNDIYFETSLIDDSKILISERGESSDDNYNILKNLFQIYYNLARSKFFIGCDIPHTDILVVRAIRLYLKHKEK